MSQIRKSMALFLSVVFSISVLATPVFAAGKTVIDIVHVNDMHARAEHSEKQNGYAGIASYYEHVKAANPKTFLVDAGDTLHGQTIATLEKGKSIVKIMNSVGFDAMVPGNHDFNYGYKTLLELEKEMKFALVACNVYEGEKSVFKPYSIVEKDGVKVAFIGATTPESAYKTHPDNVKGLTFKDVAASVEETVKKVRKDVDVVVVLSHLGIDESTLPAERSTAMADIEGIDLIVDGHSHTVLPQGKPVKEGSKTLIVSAGEYGKNIGHVQITVENKKVTGVDAKLLNPAEAKAIVAPSQKIIDEIATIKGAQSEILKVKVGSTPVDLIGEREFVRTQETNLANLVSEAILDVTGAELAMSNGGNVRATIPAGDITKENVFTVLPFGNYIVTKEMPGSAIWAVFEHGFRAYPETSGGFPQVAGMKVTFDPSKEVGKRVVSIEIGGKPIELDKTYVFATNDFLAAGGDDYVMFKDYAIKNEFGALDEVLMDYLSANKPIPEADGRIVALKEEAQPVAPAPVEPAQPAEPVPAQPIEPAQPVTPVQPIEPVAKEDKVYVVQSGDSLWKISSKVLGNGNRWREIYKANPEIKDPNRISVGQKLVIPAA